MKKILIAEAREVILAGLHTVFQEDIGTTDVTTHEDLQKQLASHSFDLVIVHQSLITDIRLLPQGRFVLLVDVPDVNMLMQAYEHQARGYFSINVTADLLRAALYATENAFSIDPVLLPWMMSILSDNIKRSDELRLLSPREQEVASLLSTGQDRKSIAGELNISEETLKTHIKNISRKKEKYQWSQKMLAHRRHVK